MSIIKSHCSTCDGSFKDHGPNTISIGMKYQQSMAINLFSDAAAILRIKITEIFQGQSFTIIEWSSNTPNPGTIHIESAQHEKEVIFEAFQGTARINGHSCRCVGGMTLKIGFDDSLVWGDEDYNDIGADITIGNPL